MTPILESLSQKRIGELAYINSEQHLYPTLSEEAREAYREEWFRNLDRSIRDDDSGHLEEYAWSAHLEEIESAYNSHCLKEIDNDIRERAKAQTAKAAVTNFALGMVTASVLALLILSPFLMDASEVAAFWREVAR